jgi:hypothetical protein
MKLGQRAMIAAKVVILNITSGREAAKIARASEQYVSHAKLVIKYASDQVDAVISGAIALNDAYEQRNGADPWLGDWWSHVEIREKGEQWSGRRKALVESADWDGPEFNTCQNIGSVCRAFTTSLRREVLSFNHHKTLAKYVTTPVAFYHVVQRPAPTHEAWAKVRLLNNRMTKPQLLS